MKKENNRSNSIVRSLVAIALMIVVGLATVGCGEVVSLEDIDTGGGGPNSLMLSWAAPTTNEDGSRLDDLAGYKLYYGTQPRQYSQVITVGAHTSAEVGDLAAGTYYLAVTAYDIYGNESDFSNEIHHSIL